MLDFFLVLFTLSRLDSEALRLLQRWGKQKEIGAIFGVDYSTVSQNRVRLKKKLKIDRKLKKQFDQFLKHFDKLSNTKI